MISGINDLLVLLWSLVRLIKVKNNKVGYACFSFAIKLRDVAVDMNLNPGEGASSFLRCVLG